MIKLNVIVNDYTSNTKSIFGYSQDDYDKVLKKWKAPNDINLLNLQVLEVFKGYTKWEDVTPEHYRIMITQIHQKISALPINDRNNIAIPEVNTFTFLVLAFVICLEKRTGSDLEMFKINVLSPTTLCFQFSGEMTLDYEQPKPLADVFSIVVDNTKDE